MMCVNRSGRSVPIYKDMLNTNTKIGTLYHNEHFSVHKIWPADGSIAISFRNSAGNFVMGFIHDDINIYTDIFDFPHSSVQIGTKWYRILKLRRNETIYKPDGKTIWSTGAAGCLVGIRNGDVGDSKLNLKKIYYVQKSSDKAWVKVDGTVSGYDKGCMPSDISLYGKGY